MKNPAQVIPAAMPAIVEVFKAAGTSGVEHTTMELVHLRASQINGCSPCVDAGVRDARKAGVTDDQLGTIVAWREAPYFSDAERAALALTEAATRLADGAEGVTDEVWSAAAKHYSEEQLAGIVLMIGVTNLFNRLNRATAQVAGEGAW
jgi:AhpD family alkylhydroperoxidase